MISKNKNKLILSLITLFIIFSLTIFVFAAEEATIDEQLKQLKTILGSSSAYSAFQTGMLLKSAQSLLDAGIIFEDTRAIIENSVEKSLDAYSIKKIFDIILETQQKSLPTESLISKVNEGLSKNVNKTIIISVISIKAENLRKAAEILNEALQEGLETNGEEEIIEILAGSLGNDVPDESLSWLLKTGTAEGKSILEISEISEELSYLSLMAYDSGLSPEEIYLLFKKAIENSSNIEEICENIQNNLEAEISTAKVESGTGETATGVSPTTDIDSSIISPSSEGTSTEIGETPTHEAGEAPTETGETPPTESEITPADETPPPPEN